VTNDQIAVTDVRLLQLSGKGLAELTGSVVDAGGTRIITVDMIEAVKRGALVSELPRAVPNMLDAARAQGVRVLQIEASFGNPRFQAWAAQKVTEHGGTFASAGGRETITFILGSP
jgi:hypothetical protein